MIEAPDELEGTSTFESSVIFTFRLGHAEPAPA